VENTPKAIKITGTNEHGERVEETVILCGTDPVESEHVYTHAAPPVADEDADPDRGVITIRSATHEELKAGLHWLDGAPPMPPVVTPRPRLSCRDCGTALDWDTAAQHTCPGRLARTIATLIVFVLLLIAALLVASWRSSPAQGAPVLSPEPAHVWAPLEGLDVVELAHELDAGGAL